MKYLLYSGFDVQLEHCDNLSLVAVMICLNVLYFSCIHHHWFSQLGSLVMFLSNNRRVPFSFFLRFLATGYRTVIELENKKDL